MVDYIHNIEIFRKKASFSAVLAWTIFAIEDLSQHNKFTTIRIIPVNIYLHCVIILQIKPLVPFVDLIIRNIDREIQAKIGEFGIRLRR